MKTLILYESTHHGNTFKLVDAIEEKYGVDLCDITNVNVDKETIDYSQYDLIGIASGIAFSKFYPGMEKFVAEKFPHNKDVFLLYTYGKRSEIYTRSVKAFLKDHGCVVKGEYGCRGFDTFGPFKLIGGIAKGHPTQEDVEGAIRFYESLMK